MEKYYSPVRDMAICSGVMGSSRNHLPVSRSHGNTGRSDLAVSYVTDLGALFPVKYLTTVLHAELQGAGDFVNIPYVP